MDKVFCMFLAISHLPTMKQCAKSADNQLRYSFKLRKPGLCFNHNCAENLVDQTEDLNIHKTDILRLYSSLFQTQQQVNERHRAEITRRLNKVRDRIRQRQGFDDGGWEYLHIQTPDRQSGVKGKTRRITTSTMEPDIQTDLDVCCPTNHYHALYTDLRNAVGVVRTIVHFQDETDPLYQFVPQGRCISGPGGSLCSGECLQEYRDHYLLVYDPEASQYPPVKFDRFRIPSYCSCKGLN